MGEEKMDDHRGTDRQAVTIGNPATEPHSEERRAALKKILVGGGIAAGSAMLPERWTRPVVDAIIAPAHAQGSPMEPFFTSTAGTFTPPS